MVSRKTRTENELLQAKYERALSTLETFVGAAMLDLQRTTNPAVVAVALTNLMAKRYAEDTDFIRVIGALAITQLAIVRKEELESKLPAPAAPEASEPADTVDPDESTEPARDEPEEGTRQADPAVRALPERGDGRG